MDAIEQLKQDVREGRIGVDRLIDVIVTQQRQLEAALQELNSAQRRIAELPCAVVDEQLVALGVPRPVLAKVRRRVLIPIAIAGIV